MVGIEFIGVEFFTSLVVLFVLLVASVQDIKSREVYDLLSLGLLFFAFGYRVIGIFESGWQFFVSGIVGFLIFFLLSLFLYYAGQWGGADSKLLMGMGMLIGFDFIFTSLKEVSMYSGFELVVFFVLLFSFGALWSLVFSLFMAVSHWKSFLEEFKVVFYKSKNYFYITIISSLLFLLLGIFIDVSILLFVIFILLAYFLFSFITAVERSSFFVQKDIVDLVEGDWLSETVFVGSKKIIAKKTLDRSDLKILLKYYGSGKLESVKIKEGVPFVPSFLLAYVFLIFGQNFFMLIFNLLY